MGHVIHINGSCHTYKWVMYRIWMQFSCRVVCRLHIWKRYFIYFDMPCRKYEPYHTSKLFMSRTWCEFRFYVESSDSESRYTYEWVLSHIWMSHGIHVNESCPTCIWALSRKWIHLVCRVIWRLKIIGLFCKRALKKRRYSAKESYHTS